MAKHNDSILTIQAGQSLSGVGAKTDTDSPNCLTGTCQYIIVAFQSELDYRCGTYFCLVCDADCPVSVKQTLAWHVFVFLDPIRRIKSILHHYDHYVRPSMWRAVAPGEVGKCSNSLSHS